MKLVKLDDDVWVNPEHVTSVERTADGAALSLVNRGIYRVNVDVYEVLDRLDPKRVERRADAEAARDWWPR